MFYNKNNGETKQRFGIRKLTIGTCSVLLSTLILSMGNNQTVHASEKTNSEPPTEEVAGSSASSSASNASAAASSENNSAEDGEQTSASSTPNSESSSATVTASSAESGNSSAASENSSSSENKKRDVSKADTAAVKANSSASNPTSSSASVSSSNAAKSGASSEISAGSSAVSSSDNIASSAVITSAGSSSSAANSDSTSVENSSGSENGKSDEVRLNVNSITSDTTLSPDDEKITSDVEKGMQTLNVAELAKTATTIDPEKLKESKAATTAASNPAPEVNSAFDPNGADYGMGFVVAGTNLTPADFLSNAAALEAAGATLSWDGDAPTATAEQAADNENPTATIKITYKDGKTATVDVGYFVTTPATTQVYSTGQSFYYVPEVNGQLSLTDVDANGVSIFNSENANNNGNNLIPTYVVDNNGYTYTIHAAFDGEPDTSTIGLHYANVKISTDTGDSGVTLIGGTYDLKVPYIVKTLQTYSDNPVIDAQLYADVTKSTSSAAPNFSLQTTASGYDSILNNSPAFARLVFKDYLQYFALGGQTIATPKQFGTVSDPLTETSFQLASLPNSTDTTVKINWVQAPTKVNDDQIMYMFAQSGGTNIRNFITVKTAFNKLLLPNGSNNVSETDLINMTEAKNGLSNYFTPIKLTNGAEAVPTGIYLFGMASGSNGKYTLQNIGVYYGQNIDSSTGEITDSNATSVNPAIASNNSALGTTTPLAHGSEFLSSAQYDEIMKINPSVGFSSGSNISNAAIPTVYYGFNQEVDTIQNPTGFTKDVDISNGPVTFNLSDWKSYSVNDTDLSDKIVAKVGTVNSKTGTTIAWPEGTKFEIMNPDNDPDISSDGQSVTMNAPGQTKTLKIKITLPGTEDISETTQVILKTNSGIGYQFVDQKTNEVVGSQVDYWAAAGSSTVTVGENATPKLTVPTGYKLVDGESLPSGEVTVPPNTPKGNLNTIYVVQDTVTHKYQFVDADEDDKTVGKPISVTGSIGESVATNLSVPDNYELAPNQSLPKDVTLTEADNGTTTDIKLVHKKVTYDPKTDTSVPDGIEQSQVQEVRTATVNYVYGTTADGHTMGEEVAGVDPAVLDVYYERSATKDLVTGDVTYGNWQWAPSYNEDGYTNGYKVVSGTWTSLPTEWANVVADVPTVDGYTAWTKTSETSVPTNQFVYPTYVNSGTSLNTDNSTAYTNDADTYEARPVHTVWYLPVETEGRVITENFKLTDENGNVTEDAAPSIQAEVFYKREATAYDSTTGEVTYGGYSWDTSAGDSSTPGIKILSGNLSDWKVSADGVPINVAWGVNPPSIKDYTLVGIGKGGAFDTTILGSPIYYGDTSFTNNNASTPMYYHNNITTYYVPNSALNKDITRTINYYLGDAAQPESTDTQSAQFSRTANVNSDDTGIIFNDWKTNPYGTNIWSSVDLTSKYAGYVPTIDGKVVDTLASVTVDPSTDSDQTVNVVYILKAADIGLSGSYEKTYDGSAATISDDIINKVTETLVNPDVTTLPDLSKLGLTTADFSFTDENGNVLTSAPTNVGTYHIILNQNGIDAFKAVDPNFTWNYDPTTAFATYTIKQATATAALSGENSKTYDGQAVTTNEVNSNDKIKVTVSIPGSTKTISYTLQDGDYTWNTSNGAAPINAKAYTISLNKDNILKNLQTAIDGTDWKNNVTINADDLSGSASYTINKAVASAVFSGSDSSTYTGQPIGDLAGNGNYKITITGVSGAPAMQYTLQKGDYYFTDASGKEVTDPTNQGTYTVHLTSQGIKNIEDQGNGNYVWTNNGSSTITGTGTYTINAAQPTATVTGTYTTTYTGSGVLTDGLLTGTGITLNINTNDATPDLTYTLKDGDYEFIPEKGGDAVKNPVNADTYKLELTDQGKQNISALTDNGNYSWSDSQISSTATVVVNKANASATFQGNAKKTYDGTPIEGYQPTVVISAPGNLTYTLKSGDYEFVPQAGGTATQAAPSNAGTYTVQLTQQGIDNIKSLNADNLNWGNITGAGTYVIDKADATITLPATSSQTAQWTGSTPTIEPSKFVPTISTTNPNATTIALPSGIQLTASDYEIVDDNGKQISPTEIGSYKVRLTDQGWQKIEDAVSGNTNYNWNYTGTGTLNIDKADATVSLSGTGSQVYTGSAIVLNKDNLGTIKVTLSNGETYDVTAADLQFVDGAPVDVGNYTGKVELSPEGLSNIAKLDSTHYNYKYDNSMANFDVTKAAATYQLSGDESKTYDGQPASLTAAGHYQVKITTNNGQQLTYTLTNDDIEFDTANNVAPTNHGVYKVKLSQTGIDHLTALNSNYNWTAKDSTATYDIKQAEMTVNLTGSAETVYNGQEQPLTQDQIDKLTLTWAGSSTVPKGINSVALTSDDIEYLEKQDDGTWKVMYGAPIHATEEGKSPYGIRLTQAGLEKVQNANKNGNYTFILGKEVQATYTIDQLKAQVTLKGYQSAPYTKNVALDPSNFQVYITNTSDNAEINVSDNQYGNHKLVAGDLVIEGYTTYPNEVGSYKVKVTDQLIDALKQIFPDYDFDAYDKDNPGVSAQDDNPSVPGSAVTNNPNNTDVAASNNDGKYIITPIDAFIKITGHQTIKYGESDALHVSSDPTQGYSIQLTDTYGNVIDGFTLTPSDLEFVTKNYQITDPKNVGDYEVTLTPTAMEKINAIGKNSLGNMNYTWIDQFTPATFTVEQMPVTITIGDKSADSHPTITYGDDVTLNPSDYTISLETENGKPLDYTLQDGDLAFADGMPTTAGTFNVVLSSQGLKNIEDKFGTQNYTYSQTGHGLFTINAAQPIVAISGEATQVYNGQAIPNYTVTATVTGPETDQTVILTGDDLEYVGADGKISTTAPVNSGDYTVQLTQAGKDKIAAVNSDNLDWTKYNWSTMTGTPTYTITKATATVTVDGSPSVAYTGSPVKLDVSQFVPTVSTNNGLTLTIPVSDLTASDYVITNKDGKEVTDPTNVGTYTIKLTEAGLEKLESQTNNYDWVNAGQGTLTISPVTPKVEINAKASKVYDGTAIANYAPRVTITAPGATPVTLTTGDFEFKVNGEWTTEAPVNAGDYKVQLTEAGLNKIKAVNSANLDWNGFTPVVNGDYVIEKANAVISLNDNQKQLSAYTGKAAVIDSADFVPAIEDTSNNTTLTAKDLNLTADDYEFVGDNGKVISPSDVVAAGTYKVRLTAAGVEKVEAAVANNSNYNWTNEGNGLYVIDTAVPTITITANAGKNGKVYDGKPGEISSDGYTITIKNSAGDVVTTLDGSSLQFTDGKTPTDVGNYKVSLTPAAIDQLKNDYPNYNWDNAGDASGEYDISKAMITVNFTGNQTKPYDGQSQNYDIKGSVTLTANNGLNITLPELDNSDLSYDPAEHVNVGTYKVQLTQAALNKILSNAGSQNYTAKFGKNDATLTITSEEGTVETKTVTRTIIISLPNANGAKPEIVQDAELSRTITTDLPSGDKTYGKWSTGKWDAFTPEEIPGYTADPISVAEESVDENTANKVVYINYKADPQKVTIKFVDTQNNDAQVGNLITKDGVTDQTIKLGLAIPAGYELAKGQTLPESYKFTAKKDQTITIKLAHKTTEVTPQDPKTPQDIIPGTDVHYPDDVGESNLVHEATRTINVTKPGQSKTTTTQHAKLTRSAIVDMVTGKVVKYSDWSLDTNEWTKFEVPEVAGYTAVISPKDSNLGAVTPTADTKDVTINIIYTPNEQKGKISYVDSDGTEITSTPLTGKTGEDVPVNVDSGVPAGWKIVPNQKIPTNKTATADGIPTVTVKIEHDTITVKPDDPKKPTDELPKGVTPGKKYPDGDDYPSGVSKDDLNETVTRIINVTTPDGTKTPTVQETKFERTATVDLVTGKVTYTKWTQKGDNGWTEFTPATIAGYTPTISKVDAENVTIETQDVTINITYTPNDQTGKIVYVDGSGNEVGTGTTSGKTDQTITVNVDNQVPDGWKVVGDSTQTVTVTPDGVPTIIVNVVPDTVEPTPTPEQSDHTIVYVDGDGNEIGRQVVTGTEGTDVPFTPEYPNGWVPVDGENIPTTVPMNGQTTTIRVTKPTPTPTPEPEQNTHTIVYVDGNGKEIGRQVISGTDGSTVQFIPSYPDGYKPADGQTIPDSVTMDGGITRIVVVSDKSNVEPTPAPLHPGKNEEPTNPTEPNKPSEKPAANNSSTSTAKTASTIVSPKATNKEAAGWKISREVVASQKNKQNNNEKTLPQTGEKDNTWIAAIGSLLAGLGIFGLAIDKRKKKDKD